MGEWAAGVLPVAVAPTGEVVVLLGLDAVSKGGQWSDFVGGHEPEDASPRHTALRELAEETGHMLPLSLVDLDSSLELRGTTPSGKQLHRFAVCIPFDAGLPGRFTGSKDDEKVVLEWFDLRRLPRMRRVFRDQMRRDAWLVARLARTRQDRALVPFRGA